MSTTTDTKTDAPKGAERNTIMKKAMNYTIPAADEKAIEAMFSAACDLPQEEYLTTVNTARKEWAEKAHAAAAEKRISAREEAKTRYNPAIDPGARGRQFELDCARPESKKNRVSKQGVADVKIRYNGKYVSAECKTNGGRVDDLLNGENKSKFVIYRMDYIQRHKAGKFTAEWEERREIAPIIVPVELFIACLLDCGAVKEMRHGGEWDGIGIQVSSKKLYQRLLAWGVLYDNTRDYYTADFEGLTL